MIEYWKGCGRAADNPTIKAGVTRCRIESVDNEMYVYFPGTGEGIKSNIGKVLAWVLNAIHPSVGGLHAGFASCLASVYLPLRREIGKRKPKKITFVGYSQGGAIAQIAAAKIGLHMGIPTVALTFASPRPFRLWYPVRIKGMNYVNGGDIVARLPFLWMFYRSGIRREKIGRKWLLPSVRDHFPQEYERALKEL